MTKDLLAGDWGERVTRDGVETTPHPRKRDDAERHRQDEAERDLPQ